MASLASFSLMKTSHVTTPRCFHYASKCRPENLSFSKYSLKSPIVSLTKWVCKSDVRSYGAGSDRGYGAGSDGGHGADSEGEDEGSLYLRHRDQTFVVVIGPGIVYGSPQLQQVLKDISVLHSFGLRFVLIPGVDHVVDMRLIQRGISPKYGGGRYRTTDLDRLDTAISEVGKARFQIEAVFSGENFVRVITGNYIVAERIPKYGATGKVISMDTDRISKELRNSIVVVGQLGVSTFREILCCDLYELATSCAVALKAKKLVYVVGGSLLDDALLNIHLLSDRAINAGVRVSSIDASVDGAMLNFFQRDY